MRKRKNLWSGSQFKKCSRVTSHPEDRISFLPEDIRLFILSFLTFKEVANTSLLSSQWLKLWLRNPVLNFHAPDSDDINVPKSERERERENYVNWVNNVLRLHQGQFLKEFRIICFIGKKYQTDIDRWLAYALARNVQSLELNLCHLGHPVNQHENYVFPKRFLNLSHGEAIGFYFKSLKSLSLKRVDVTGEEINFFLLNCPYLERLEVMGTLKLVNLIISGPTLVLKHLLIMHCFNMEVLTISNFNLVSLNISAIRYLTLSNLPMLVELFISGYSNKFVDSFSRASSCYSQLESLTLDAIEHEDITRLSNLGQMTKLKRLAIEVLASFDESLIELFSFINSCPHLMEFVLTLCWASPERSSRALCKGEKRSLQCLEVFEFVSYYGRVSDVELVMHVVENAACLKKIIIHTCIRMGYDSSSTIEQEARSVALSQFERLRASIPSHVDIVIN